MCFLFVTCLLFLGTFLNWSKLRAEEPQSLGGIFCFPFTLTPSRQPFLLPSEKPCVLFKIPPFWSTVNAISFPSRPVRIPKALLSVLGAAFLFGIDIELGSEGAHFPTTIPFSWPDLGPNSPWLGSFLMSSAWHSLYFVCVFLWSSAGWLVQHNLVSHCWKQNLPLIFVKTKQNTNSETSRLIWKSNLYDLPLDNLESYCPALRAGLYHWPNTQKYLFFMCLLGGGLAGVNPVVICLIFFFNSVDEFVSSDIM